MTLLTGGHRSVWSEGDRDLWFVVSGLVASHQITANRFLFSFQSAQKCQRVRKRGGRRGGSDGEGVLSNAGGAPTMRGRACYGWCNVEVRSGFRGWRDLVAFRGDLDGVKSDHCDGWVWFVQRDHARGGREGSLCSSGPFHMFRATKEGSGGFECRDTPDQQQRF